MPINKETIISAYDEKLTLMQWLKTINKALEDAVLTGVTINKKGNATLSFVFNFEDGTTLETDDLILQQGESINGATIRNGHLYLSLTNGNELDAGNLKPVTSFTINASQHLIVNYGDGTSQDLGAIFNGDININGNITANNINENPIALTYTKLTSQLQWNDKYIGVWKNGNKITFIFFYSFEYASDLISNPTLAEISIPSEIASKLYPYQIGGSNDVLDMQTIGIVSTDWQYKSIHVAMAKGYNKVILKIYDLNSMSLTIGKTYLVRYEATFLLSNSLAG